MTSPANPLNFCRSCKQDFAGTGYFDQHRVGVHDFTLARGLKFDPPREDGRRCMTLDELRAAGLVLNNDGRWSDPKKVAAVRAAFTRVDSGPTVSHTEALVPQTTNVGEGTRNDS